MRNIWKVLVFLLLPLGTFSQGTIENAISGEKQLKNQLYFQPLKLKQDNLVLTYQRNFSSKVSIALKAGFTVGMHYGDWSSGYNSGLQLKYYVWKLDFFTDHRVMSHIYTSGYGDYRNLNITLKKDKLENLPAPVLTEENYWEDNSRRIEGGLLLGMEWIIKQIFVVDIFAGPAYQRSFFSSVALPRNLSSSSPYYTGFFAKAGIAVGIRF